MFIQLKPLRKLKKKKRKNSAYRQFVNGEICTEASLYNEYGSPGWPKNVLRIKPLKEIKKEFIQKIASLENWTTKKISSGPSLCYDGFGRCDFQKNVHLIKTLGNEKELNELHLLRLCQRRKWALFSYDCPKNFLLIKPLKEVEKMIIKLRLWRNR